MVIPSPADDSMTDHTDDEIQDIARARGQGYMERMSAEERTAFVARALANAAFSNDPLLEELLPRLFATIEEISEETRMSAEAVAIEAFRRHGYRAEMQHIGELAMMRAVRVQG